MIKYKAEGVSREAETEKSIAVSDYLVQIA